MRTEILPPDIGPARRTDLLAFTLATFFTLAYLTRLPLHTQITVRYLVPIVPLCIYGVARLPSTRAAVDAGWRWLGGWYLSTVSFGVLGTVAVHAWLALGIGESMQFHALIGLAAGTLAALAALGRALGLWTDNRVDAVAMAVPAGLTTVFLLFTGIVYFEYGSYALPVARLVSDLLTVAF